MRDRNFVRKEGIHSCYFLYNNDCISTSYYFISQEAAEPAVMATPVALPQLLMLTSEKASSIATASPSGKRPIEVNISTSPITINWHPSNHRKRDRPDADRV